MSSLVDYLDKGASLGRDAPCLVEGAQTVSYGEVQDLSWSVAGALSAAGVRPGDKVGILSANNARAFACVFGIARLGAVWCPINPRNETAENRALLELFDCDCLLYHSAYEAMVREIPLRVAVCLDRDDEFVDWLSQRDPVEPSDPPEDLAMLVGTGGTTGLPKGVMLTARNLETMTALTLMGYPFAGRPAYLALAPLTHAAGVLCFPVLALGGRIVVMPKPDLGAFLELIERERITHTFLPPTLIYMLLGHARVHETDFSSLQCFWYGAAPMSVARLAEALVVIGPVMAQLFGQSEAPMMVSMLPPAEHFDSSGNVATRRLASAGRPSPLVQVAIMDADGHVLGTGERGEIVVRGSLVMAGYYKDPEATAQASRFGWHHTGDVGYLDDEGYLFIVDRLKDMIITGGFNVYSAEVEQALMQHPAVRDCAVIGLPDEKWGERVEAVVELKPGVETSVPELIGFVKERIGSVKAPKAIAIWTELPRSRVGKVLKTEVRTSLLGG
ncbi:long-chain fatty acid--CoA ligase [Solirubrobacter phytolaccae]|uniref:Long-chain fatty acid--CoA ligase n=1 Tax=Solirubrobacter phytolaccae TaxID=1404360 RepID=A0A9X3S9P0_9ACTN|nr:long-chain fatty acid--CoA ligase [Solirubrobacter phytolaccae]MDA0182808.1 long-chain fatty acid--CoA ligase [Solirubrobacter phytolaccae]